VVWKFRPQVSLLASVALFAFDTHTHTHTHTHAHTQHTEQLCKDEETKDLFNFFDKMRGNVVEPSAASSVGGGGGGVGGGANQCFLSREAYRDRSLFGLW
jgi:hypothetical protein